MEHETPKWATLSEFLREAARKVALLEDGGVQFTEKELAVCTARISQAIAAAAIPEPMPSTHKPGYSFIGRGSIVSAKIIKPED